MSDTGCYGLNIITGNVGNIYILYSIMSSFGVMSLVPTSPDYIPGPEVPPSPDYIPWPLRFHHRRTTYLAPRSRSRHPPPGLCSNTDPEEAAERRRRRIHPAPSRLCPTCTPYECQDIYPDEPNHITSPPRERGSEDFMPKTTPTTITTYSTSSPLPQINEGVSDKKKKKRVRFASLTPSREVEESSAAGAARQDRPTIAREEPLRICRYGAIDEIAPTTVEGVNQRVTDLATIIEEETTSIYAMQPVKYYRLFPASRLYRSFVCLATQYRSFVQAMINEGVTAALAARDATKMAMIAILQERVPEGLSMPVKFATCTLQGNALTWWNSHVKTTNSEACPQCHGGHMKKDDDRQILAQGQNKETIVRKLEFEEIDQVEKYVEALPDTIHGSVMATKPKTMQDAIEFATELNG
ncbi:hypothetical protein Tco_1227668 [Tanacetum coccineum]